ncbi:uncharacterized protein BO87DRAFT_214102 [Aspergillus neoniger CBS 115656]|uniref:Uncharacterized protein n=1 Tax=Aspergillus neoniger (strain CBS 115656) TaxID=1448310 RepID=A0A318Y8E0_ASPNB|nr:hypothetical protein BO87DRAFT_214102 [Aspergillus neoniger CBS 115656]PYH28573.1 hypothetical protein BO87DRAFT_214102 [Aspergillus neoniger CBS 115656]
MTECYWMVLCVLNCLPLLANSEVASLFFLSLLLFMHYRGLVFLVLSITLHIITNLFYSELSMQQTRCLPENLLFSMHYHHSLNRVCKLTLNWVAFSCLHALFYCLFILRAVVARALDTMAPCEVSHSNSFIDSSNLVMGLHQTT